MTVHFKVWDVDDPFDQVYGPYGSQDAVADVGLVDGNMSGPDNRPSPEAPQTAKVVTNPHGQAVYTLTVSMQPPH